MSAFSFIKDNNSYNDKTNDFHGDRPGVQGLNTSIFFQILAHFHLYLYTKYHLLEFHEIGH